MPRKQKGENNPLYTKRTVLKKSRMKGRGVAQKDLVATSDAPNPTEALQTRPAETPQRVDPQFMSRVVTPLVPTMGNATLNTPPPPPPRYLFNSPTPAIDSFNWDDFAHTRDYSTDTGVSYELPKVSEGTLDSPPSPAKGVWNTEDDDLWGQTLHKMAPSSPIPSMLYPDSAPSPLQPNSGTTASNPLSEATGRFLNTLGEFLGGLNNPNK